MNEMFFYQNYESEADILALLLCIVVFFLLRSTYIVKKENLRIFRMVNFLVFIAALTSLGYHTLLHSVSPQILCFIYLFRVSTYTSLIGTYACYCFYIKNLVDMSEKHQSRFKNCINAASFIFVTIQLLSPVLKWGFYVDKDMMVHQNVLTDVYVYASVYYSVTIISLLLIFRKKFIGKMYIALCSVMALSSITLAVQSIFKMTSYTVVCFALPVVVILFLFHYNSFDVETGTMDQYAFREYIRDKKDKVAMVFLSLPGISSEKLSLFSKEFLRKNDSYFDNSYCFRLKDNRMVLVYPKDNNRDYTKAYEHLYKEFNKAKRTSDYKVILMDGTPRIQDGKEYVAFFKFVENRMPINFIKVAGEEEIDNFLKYKYIYENLEDIYIKGDLNDPRIKVFCQPVLNTQSHIFTTAEALMRIELPGMGMIFPDQFIHIAEEYDFIHTLSKIILNKTCQNIKKLETEGYYIERISINCSVQEMRLDNFCSDIIDIIEMNGISPEKIAIEITETKSENDFISMKDVIERLQKRGIKFYLDDFGTGYSNFERIIGLPIDIIKFDRSLTILASKNDESKFMVGSFSEIFKKAEYHILFEGVEDDNDEDQCISMNAEYLQGYKYSRPIPMENLKDFLEKRQQNV